MLIINNDHSTCNYYIYTVRVQDVTGNSDTDYNDTLLKNNL